MNPYKELYHYALNYFSTKDDEEKAYWVEKAIILIYEIEDEEFVDECIFNTDDDEIYMENIRQYAYIKINMKKIW